MKTGLNLVVDPAKDADEFVEQSTSLFLVLLEEAMGSAATYARATNRDVVTSEDVLYGMQYQAHQFANVPNVHERSRAAMEEWKKMNVDDEGSGSDDEGSGNGSDDDEGNGSDDEGSGSGSDDGFVVAEEDCAPFERAPDSHGEVIALMNYYHDTWDSWEPETDVERLLKTTIDSNRVSDTSTGSCTA